MKVEILDGCTGCGSCEAINSDVFKVNGVAHVDSQMIKGNEQDCRDAAAQCPVNVIKVYE